MHPRPQKTENVLPVRAYVSSDSRLGGWCLSHVESPSKGVDLDPKMGGVGVE